jgi:hypothetical protein
MEYPFERAAYGITSGSSESDPPVADNDAKFSLRVEEMERQARVLALEKELAIARMGLAALRRSAYSKDAAACDQAIKSQSSKEPTRQPLIGAAEAASLEAISQSKNRLTNGNLVSLEKRSNLLEMAVHGCAVKNDPSKQPSSRSTLPTLSPSLPTLPSCHDSPSRSDSRHLDDLDDIFRECAIGTPNQQRNAPEQSQQGSLDDSTSGKRDAAIPEEGFNDVDPSSSAFSESEEFGPTPAFTETRKQKTDIGSQLPLLVDLDELTNAAQGDAHSSH